MILMCFVLVLLAIGLVAAWVCDSWAIAGLCVLIFVICAIIGYLMVFKDSKTTMPDKNVSIKAKKHKKEYKELSVPVKKNDNKKQMPKKLPVDDKQKKLPVDLDLIKYVPEEKLGEVVNSLTLKYGISAAVIWAAIHEARKDVAPVAKTEDKVYWEDFYGDDRNRDVYLDDYELDELDDDERDELLEDLDDDDDSYNSQDSWSSDDSWCSHDSFDSHDDFGHDDYGGDSWGDND